jgi:hypothetical protein
MKIQLPVFPITNKRFSELVLAWANIAKYQESGSIYYYSKADFLRRFNQLINDKKTYRKYFGKKSITLIDAENLMLEDREDWDKYLHTKNPFDIYFICGLDSILMEKNNAILCYLQKKPKALQASFLFFFSLDFQNSEFIELFKDKTAFTQNVIFHSLHSKSDTLQFIKHLENKWQINIDKNAKQTITGKCSGHFLLVKQAVRHLRDYPTDDLKKVLNSQQMLWKCRIVWSKFLSTEQEVIIKILKGSPVFTLDEKHSLMFLKKVQFIKKDGLGYKLTIPILEDYIRRTQLYISLTLGKDQHILANSVAVDNNFSKQERELLKLFLDNENIELSREQVASVLWKTNWQDKYSDWAIDQIISRLRKKLCLLGVDRKCIRTIRKKGYLYQSLTDYEN